MSQNNSALIGSIIERKPTQKSTSPRSAVANQTGFPSVQHRSNSAFARSRENARKAGPPTSNGPPRPNQPPLVVPDRMSSQPSTIGQPDNWREQISRENEERVASMNEDEVEEEKRQILERFGTGISEVLKRARQARERQMAKDHSRQGTVPPPENEIRNKLSSMAEVPITRSESPSRAKSPNRGRSPPPPALSTASSRPSSRLDRKIRFAELSPDDVHVYDSAPPSPHKRAVLALPAPTPEDHAVSLGQWHGKMLPQQPETSQASTSDSNAIEPEEGTAEYIRRRYFPDAPANDPNLAWTKLTPSAVDNATSSLRFDLHGNPISPSLSSTLPTHLGLHHHAEGSHAGYTLDDIFLLSRSTVPAQRATMLSVLARIAEKIARAKQGEVNGIDETVGKEEELRKRIVAAGVEAMTERGSVGARAIEVIWTCVVEWDEKLLDFEGVELETPSDLALASLPLDFLLPQMAIIFAQGDAAPESLSQLLAVIYRLAQHSNEIASAITSTPKLLSGILQTFLLTPIPPPESSPFPDPSAIQLFITLAMSSRTNAKAVAEIVDPLLRFLTFIPSSSPFGRGLATGLLTATLSLYTILASYGFYAHIAITALEKFSQLGQYVISDECTSRKLMSAWMGLLEAWTICAIDPHKTTPSHEILWSQVMGGDWNIEAIDLQRRLGVIEQDWRVWSKTWGVLAAWLEGSKINGVRGGEAERAEFIEAVKEGFETGNERDVVRGSVDALWAGLSQSGVSKESLRSLAVYADVLTAAIRLWLACVPPHTNGPPESPPFALPFPRISELCSKLLLHPLWSVLSPHDSNSYIYVYCRQLSGLLSYFLRLSRRLPGITEDLWMAQAFSILSRLMPGDEEFGLQLTGELLSLMTPEWAAPRSLQAPPSFWEKGGMAILNPFFVNTIHAINEVSIGPILMSPHSIQLATTQRLPSPSKLSTFGLPLYRDWTLTPLEHLLRSGDSVVFKALPVTWDASEVEVTRASLFFTRIVRDVLQRFSLWDFVLSREEAVFGCMKVFMLEHGQPQNDSTEEVFRDHTVGQLMEDVIRPYTVGAAGSASPSGPVIPSADQQSLEQVAIRFLGASVPFYQYYTDFVALYDAISFSHPLFARLLLPPTSMRYLRDYRKHLWDDFNHVLRTIHMPFDQVISGDIREYLYPLEIDPELIGSYLRSLLNGSLQDFVRLVALHHIASNIWPDLQDVETYNEQRASRLLKIIVDQGSNDVVREVVQYRQRRSELLLPPACFSGAMDVRTSRMEFASRCGGSALTTKLDGIFV